jgi:hypothetical protein
VDNAGPPEEAWLSVVVGSRPVISSEVIDHVASYAQALTTLVATAGYPPGRLDVGLQRIAPRVYEVFARADIPGLADDDAEFIRLATAAVPLSSLWQALPADAEIRVRAGADARPVRLATSAVVRTPPAVRAVPARSWVPRVVTAVILGLTLGVLGLPRLDISALRQLVPPVFSPLTGG